MPKDSDQKVPEAPSYLARGMALGLVFGAALGVVFGVVLDNMAFLSIGVGAGLIFGVSIGTALQGRQKENGTESPSLQGPDSRPT